MIRETTKTLLHSLQKPPAAQDEGLAFVTHSETDDLVVQLWCTPERFATYSSGLVASFPFPHAEARVLAFAILRHWAPDVDKVVAYLERDFVVAEKDCHAFPGPPNPFCVLPDESPPGGRYVELDFSIYPVTDDMVVELWCAPELFATYSYGRLPSFPLPYNASLFLACSLLRQQASDVDDVIALVRAFCAEDARARAFRAEEERVRSAPEAVASGAGGTTQPAVSGHQTPSKGG